MFTALAMKVRLKIVNMQNGMLTATVITLKMHQSSALITLEVLVSLQSRISYFVSVCFSRLRRSVRDCCVAIQKTLSVVVLFTRFQICHLADK